MIGYVTLGTNDLQRGAAFYDALFAEMGAKRLWDRGTMIAWGVAMDKPAVVLGNGMMVALVVKSKDMVDRVYQKAIALGAKDEGPNGPRGEQFYAGYFRDLDGNKLNVFCMG